MKKCIVFFLSCYALAACTDSVDFAQVKKEIVNYNGGESGGIGQIGEYKWTRLPDQYLGDFDYYDYTFPFVVDGTAYCLAGYGVSMPFKLNNRTKKWESFVTDFDFNGFYGQYLFSYGSKIYYNFKKAEDGYAKRNIGAFDMNTGNEQEKAQFPVDFPVDYFSFVVGNKGYLMGGRRLPGLPLNEMWEYDFDLDQWTNKGTMPGGARAGGVGFVMGNKVYFGLGYNIITMNGQNIERPRRDWMSFNPTTSTYAAVLPDFPGSLDRIRGFALNDKIYMRDGFCNVNDTGCDELWEYNIASGKWSKKSVPERRTTNINFFSLGNVGYMVVGSFEEFWKYSTSTLVPIP
jgi:hypothetical protein